MKKGTEDEILKAKIEKLASEPIELSDYNPLWSEFFEKEKAHILKIFQKDSIVKIEHFGSTAVPNLIAKPIIDMDIEVNDTERAKIIIPEILEPLGYERFWEPPAEDNAFHILYIKRNKIGERSHHLHFFKEGGNAKELRFRDVLRANPTIAREYGKLKIELAKEYRFNRTAYTDAKSEFIQSVSKQANII